MVRSGDGAGPSCSLAGGPAGIAVLWAPLQQPGTSATARGPAIGPVWPPCAVLGSGRGGGEDHGPTLVGLDLTVPAKDSSVQEGPLPSFHSLKRFGITSSMTLNEPPDDGGANTTLPTPGAVLGGVESNRCQVCGEHRWVTSCAPGTVGEQRRIRTGLLHSRTPLI